MYEEYQQNPNPGFDRRSRYEDAGGYLRSILGSFLNQKKTADDEARDEARFQAKMKQDEELARLARDSRDPVVQDAMMEAYLDREGITDPVLRESRKTSMRKMHNPYYQEVGAAEGRADVVEKYPVQGVDPNAFTALGGKNVQSGINAQTNADAQRDKATITSQGEITEENIRANAPPKTPTKEPKPVNPNKFADGVEIDAADAVVKNVIEQLKGAKKIEEVPSYDTLRSSLKALTTEAKTRGLTKKQKDALQTIVQAGVKLTPAQAAEAARAILDFTEAPSGPAEPTGGGIEPRVITMGGTRYLEDADGQLYEMIMG